MIKGKGKIGRHEKVENGRRKKEEGRGEKVEGRRRGENEEKERVRGLV